VLYDRQLGYAVGAPDVLSLLRVVSSKKLLSGKQCDLYEPVWGAADP